MASTESKFATDRRHRATRDAAERIDEEKRRVRNDPRQVESGGSSSLRDRPLQPGESAPPRGALMRMGPVSGGLEALGQAGEFAAREFNPSFGGRPAPPPPAVPRPSSEADPAAVGAAATPTVPRPNPGAEEQRAADQARFRAAALGAGENPRGQAENQKPAPQSTDVKTTPATPTNGGSSAAPSGRTPGPGRTQVKMPDGRYVFVTEDRGKDYVAGGGEYASYQDATAGLGKPQAERFMKDRTFRDTSRSESLPYSEQVRALANDGSIDLADEGQSGFGLAPPGSGGPIQGTRRLSGIEQATERRAWLEGRANQEQASELQRAEVDRQKRLAEMDPLEMARIQAQGRMGGDLAKVQLDLRAREEARQAFLSISSQIQQLTDQLAGASPEEAADIQRYMDYLERTRRELSNLILGERLSEPRSAAADAFGMALAGLGSAGAGAPTTGAR